ncbi:hypothetical protein Tco_0409288 [Tanacetum coccineum]
MSNLILTKLDLKEQNEQLVKDLRTARISVVSYKTGLESVEARLLVFKKNESVYEEDIKLLKREIYLRDLDITELKRKLELATKEKDECKIGLGYNAVPPPYTGNFMPPKSDLVYPSLDDFVDVNESVSESVVEKPTVETNEPKTARKENEAPIIEIDQLIPDSTKNIVNNGKTHKNVINNAYSTAMKNFNKITAANNSNISTKKVNTVKGTRVNTARPKAILSAVKETKEMLLKPQHVGFAIPQQDLKDKGVIDSGFSRHMTGNRSYLADYEEIDGGFVAFGDYILLPMWPADPLFFQNLNESPDAGIKPSGEKEKMDTEDPENENEASGKDSEVPSTKELREDQRVNQELDASINSTNNINTASPTVNAVRIEDNVVDENIVYGCADDPNMPELEGIVYSDDDEDVGVEANMNDLNTFMPVSPIPTTRIHKDHQ